MATVVIIEDEPGIRDLTVRALADAGHIPIAEETGMGGLQAIVESGPDIVILDLGLPDVDGGDILQMIRAVSTVPVIVATARDDDAEIVRLLDAGADEYVVKPFSGVELEARIRALLRRAAVGGPSRVLRVGGISIRLQERTATIDDVELNLNRKEFDLLAHLAANEGTVVDRQELFAAVWRQPYGGGDRTLDVHLSWLRRKLGETAAEPHYLHTIRGVGIKLADPG